MWRHTDHFGTMTSENQVQDGHFLEIMKKKGAAHSWVVMVRHLQIFITYRRGSLGKYVCHCNKYERHGELKSVASNLANAVHSDLNLALTLRWNERKRKTEG